MVHADMQVLGHDLELTVSLDGRPPWRWRIRTGFPQQRPIAARWQQPVWAPDRLLAESVVAHLSADPWQPARGVPRLAQFKG